MFKKNKVSSILCFSIIFLFLLAGLCYAAPAKSSSSSTTSSGTSTSNKSSTPGTSNNGGAAGGGSVVIGGGGPSGSSELTEVKEQNKSIFQKITDLASSVSVMGTNITEFVKKIKEFFDDGLYGVLQKTFGYIAEAPFKLIQEGLKTWVFRTPYVHNMNWVMRLWWFCAIISLFITLFGVAMLTFKMLSGKGRNSNDNGKGILIGLVCGLMFSWFSLWISDAIIYGINLGADALSKDILVKEYKDAIKDNPQNSGILLSNIDPEKITGFADFDGLTICKLAFDKDALKIANSNINERDKMFYVFSDLKQHQGDQVVGQFNGGGIITIFWGMLVLFLMGILGLARMLVTAMLAGGSGFWFSGTAITGNTDPLVGWGNLYTRSVLMGFLFDVAWYLTYYAVRNQADFLNMGQILGCFIFTVALIASWFLWIKPLIGAIMNPMTLNGASVRTSFGSFLENTGKTVAGIGERFDFMPGDMANKMMQVGGRMAAEGRERQRIEEEKRKGTYDPTQGSSRERIDLARKKYDEQFNKRIAERASNKTLIREAGDSSKNVALSEVEAAGLSNDRVKTILQDKMNNAVYDTGDGFYVDSDHTDQAEQVIKDTFSKDYMRSFKNGMLDGKIFSNLSQSEVDEIKSAFDETDTFYENAYSINMNGSGVDQMISLYDSMSSLGEEMITETVVGDKPYYEIKVAGAVKDNLERFLDANNVPRSPSKDKNTVRVAKSSFDSLTEKWGTMKEAVSHMEKDRKGNYSYTGLDRSKYSNVKELLDSSKAEYTSSESLWVDNSAADNYVGSMFSSSKTGDKASLEFTRFKLDADKQQKEEIVDMLRSSLPPAAVKLTNTDILVETEMADVARSAISDFMRLDTYTYDGRYYYYKDSSSRYIKQHITPPPDISVNIDESTDKDGNKVWEYKGMSGYRKIK